MKFEITQFGIIRF